MLSGLLIVTQLGVEPCFVMPDIALANLEQVQTEQDTEVRMNKWYKYSLRVLKVFTGEQCRQI